jgi:cyclophilin family peptidyl-prolyl cis-trans isomerase
MRSRALPITLGIIVVILIAVGFYFNQRIKNEAIPGAPEQMSSSIPTAGIASPEPGASISPAASTSPTPSGSAVPVDLTVDTNGLSKTTAVFETTKGSFKFKFYSKDAPNTVNRIIELVQKGFYNGIVFHRVEPGFVAQTGDPTGTGQGGSGTKLNAEFNDRHHMEGTVAMARTSDPNSADSQFYITFGPQPRLDHQYTVFGQVIDGMDSVRKLQVGDKITSAHIE